jgi:uncharacterized protein (DUF58 family)
MPANVQIRSKLSWPLALLPILLINQFFAPHVIWVVLLIVIGGLYAMGILWIRSQAPKVRLERMRVGTILVAGDILHEEFELGNDSRIPVLWAEFVDESNVPGYTPGRVVACGSSSIYRWKSEVECWKRGVYRLGPHRLTLGEPFGLFEAELRFSYSDMVLIYPRVVMLPRLPLPHGNTRGADRRRRPQRGTEPATTVSDYRPGDSLRFIHWRTTAHRGRLMVKELEIEPSGDVWIVLDLNGAVHSGENESSTLEYSITVAASLAAELLSGGERRAVGLLTVAGMTPWPGDGAPAEASGADGEQEAVIVPPQSGQAQLWKILATLAPVHASHVDLAELLRSSRGALGRRRTLVVITPQVNLEPASSVPGTKLAATTNGNEMADLFWRQPSGEASWVGELLHLRASGVDSSVLLVEPGRKDESTAAPSGAGEQLHALLARHEIPAQVLQAGTPLRSVLTFRRTRKVIRSTPTGGVVTYEVEEEVG